MNTKPIRKEPYDWREGVCKFCGVEATNGCCSKHCMECPLCRGFGAVSKAVWEEAYNKRVGFRSGLVSNETDELKEWIFNRLDEIDRYGCESCWSDSHNCTCEKDKRQKRIEFLNQITEKLTN